jgi:hypothetical protein
MHESPLPHTRDMHGFSICSDSATYPSNQKTETNNASRVWEMEGCTDLGSLRDPAVQVRLSMGPPVPDVLLGCCGRRPAMGSVAWSREPRAGGDKTERSGTLKSDEAMAC